MPELIVTVDCTGAIITETDCGAWTCAGGLGVQGNDGYVRPTSSLSQRARTVARLLSEETGETITIDMVLDAWEAIRG